MDMTTTTRRPDQASSASRGKLVYVRGDATCFHQAPNREQQHDDGAIADMICHVVNNVGAWGAGFTAALDAHYKPWARQTYRQAWETLRSSVPYSGLGGVGIYPYPRSPGVAQNIYLAHLFAQDGLRCRTNPRPFKLSALVSCIEHVCAMITGQVTQGQRPPGWVRIHMPRIGTGLGGGNWSEIEPQVRRLTAVAPVYVYDLPPAQIYPTRKGN